MNYYPITPQKAEDGVALVALGLGHTVAHGGAAVRFSPAYPDRLPQFTSPRDVVRQGQVSFYTLDLSRPRVDFLAGTEASLCVCGLEEAEADGTLAFVGSVYSRDDDAIRDDLSRSGRRVVTFNSILKWKDIPLAPALAELLNIFREGVGRPVEIEFAVDMTDRGKRLPSGQEPRMPVLYVLQIRPLAVQACQEHVEPREVPARRVLCRTRRSLGHGTFTDIRDVIYVRRDDLNHRATPQVAEQIAIFNERLSAAARPFLLIGPGRWGSADPNLGIPVQWSHISGVRMLAETDFADRSVDPSMGTHFFRNLYARGIGYLSLPRAHRKPKRGDVEDFIDLKWLDDQPAVDATPEVRHVRFEQPLVGYLDGRKGRAVVLKPGADDRCPEL